MGALTENSKATQQIKSAENSSPDRSAVGQGHYPNSIFHLQHTIGNQAVLRLLQEDTEKRYAIPAAKESPDSARDIPSISAKPAIAKTIQSKLVVNTPGDEYEQEADRVAAQVMRMTGPDAAARPPATGAVQGVQRSSADVPQTSREDSTPTNAGTAAPPIVDEVLRSPGSPLDTATRTFMESRFGNDFSDVRVHIDSQAAESATVVHARAYTVGKNVVFGAGQFAPASHDGRRLLAHELTHVLQQGKPQPGKQEAAGPALSAPLAPAHHDSGMMLRREPLNDSRQLRVETEQTPRSFHKSEWLDTAGGSSTEELYWIKFDVDEKGVMTASARTVSPDRKLRSARLRFTDELNSALDYFKGKGLEVKEFEGDWSYMTPDEISDNLRIFQQGITQGMTREDAASNTPTGKAVAKAGFKVVRGAVKDVQESQEHLAEQGVQRPRVKALFRRIPGQAPDAPSGGTGGSGKQPTTSVKPAVPDDSTSEGSQQVKGQGGVKPPASTGVDPANAGTGKSPQVKSQGGVKPPAGTDVDPGAAGAGKSPQVKGQGGVKPPAGTDVDPGGAGKTSGTTPAQKTGGQASLSGRSGGLAIQVGAGIATVGLEWLASILKMKRDAKTAQRQIEAFLAVATKKINANPDEAVKVMMTDPDRTFYAWIHLDSTVITSLGADPISGDPTLNNSSPTFDLGPIEYMSWPLDPSLITSFPKIGGGGLAPTVTRTIIIDVPLTTPPLENLIDYAKTRNFPLDDLHIYVLKQLQAAASSNVSVAEANVRLYEAYQAGEDAWNKLDAEYKNAEKRHDVKRQAAILQLMMPLTRSQMSLSAQIKTSEESVQKSGEKVQYWRHLLDVTDPANTRP